MANIKIAAIADTTQISNTVKSFIDRNPELQDGAVIIKDVRVAVERIRMSGSP
ncbi:hypothetical protein [Klebsiella quasipneumoniae]|uniref:hypothetical protein n=1 Tax=Klebsiella quasipneumoniae TaxID=1463165 RepID=UPI00220EEA18|nr:hypothetical protein [Klebsiella quasipneumoniae]BDO05728.1 hypothetical protein KAM622c_53150 [Klebsiella quasipneumoniae subsp. quasipneumoniae]